MSINVAILGATGMVGQKVIALLSRDSDFHIHELSASDKHIGKHFSDACDWREPLMQMPTNVASITLKSAKDIKAQFVISCLPAEVAAIVEPILAQQGKIIFSNASAHRMLPSVPLLVPEINSNHLDLLSNQQTQGKIITNPNCSAAGITLALAPIMQLGDVEHISIVTMQSISGAGYPGMSSLDILNNTVPHIPAEAGKITAETKKILGQPGKPAELSITTHVHRVPVVYGHVATVHVMFKHNVSKQNAIDCYREWNERHPNLFVIHEQDGRPQAARDLTHDDMRVNIGHITSNENVLGFVVLTNNLVRGAAGAVIGTMKSYLKSVRS